MTTPRDVMGALETLSVPQMSVNQALEVLDAIGLTCRLVYLPGSPRRAVLGLQLAAEYATPAVEVLPAAMADLNWNGWTEDQPKTPYEPVVSTEDVVDAVLTALGLPALGPRLPWTSEWTARARISAAQDVVAAH